MSRKYKFYNNNDIYFVTWTVNKWIDLFTRNIYRDTVLDTLRFCQKNKGLEMYAYCIMTNHLHLIIGSVQVALSDIMRDAKKYISKKVKSILQAGEQESRKAWLLDLFLKKPQNQFRLWEPYCHPIQLFNANMVQQKLDYIHKNPLVAGFVDKEESWVYSSAADYYLGKRGLLPIKFV